MNAKITKGNLTKENLTTFNLLIEEMMKSSIASEFSVPVDYVGNSILYSNYI
jgi:hypothetical protein